VRHFCHLATRRLGIGINPKVESLVAGRVAKRIQLLQLPIDEYRRRLDDDEDCDEVVGFLDFVRPSPMRFFARQSEYEDLYVHIVRRLEDGQRRLRLWSAGCGTGEEAYGMLMSAWGAIDAAGIARDRVDLKILATDISPRALELGRRGRYDEAQLANLPSRMREIYFCEAEEGHVFDEQAKGRVFFRRLNLARPPYPMAGPFDAIFCREGVTPMVPRARMCAVDAALALLAQDGIIRTGFDYQAIVKAAGDEEDQRQERVRRRSRAHGHC
jgi:chemotaxis protein methyltransferase CheR